MSSMKSSQSEGTQVVSSISISESQIDPPTHDLRLELRDASRQTIVPCSLNTVHCAHLRRGSPGFRSSPGAKPSSGSSVHAICVTTGVTGPPAPPPLKWPYYHSSAGELSIQEREGKGKEGEFREMKPGIKCYFCRETEERDSTAGL